MNAPAYRNKLLRAQIVEMRSPDWGRFRVPHATHGQVLVTCRMPDRIPPRNLMRLSEQGRLWFDEERWRVVLRPLVRLVAEHGSVRP